MGCTQPRGPIPDLKATFPVALAGLEKSVHDLLANGWQDEPREMTLAVATVLSEASKLAGWKVTAGLLHAVASIVELPAAQIGPDRQGVRDRLVELFDHLKGSAKSESA